MRLLNHIQEMVTKLMQVVTARWWVEINTTEPRCIYYFGPFDTFAEASHARFGYIEDLAGEGAQQITVEIKRCRPKVLTVYFPEVEE